MSAPVDQQPVGLNMALTHPLIITGICQRMISILSWKWLFGAQHCNDSLQFLGVAAAFDSLLIVALELP